MKTQIQPWGKHEKASLAPRGNTVLQLPKRLLIQPGTFLGGDSIAPSQGCCCPGTQGQHCLRSVQALAELVSTGRVRECILMPANGG